MRKKLAQLGGSNRFFDTDCARLQFASPAEATKRRCEGSVWLASPPDRSGAEAPEGLV